MNDHQQAAHVQLATESNQKFMGSDQQQGSNGSGRRITTVVLVLVMLCASALASYFTPHKFLADQGDKVVLETMVPKQFGVWRVDPSIVPVVADPTQLELSDRIYSETLSRTYINDRGDRVMLTVAYGRDQSESLQLHTPEFCYPAQGFKVTPSEFRLMKIGAKQQPVVQLQASIGSRFEPITYWVTLGEYVVNGGHRGRRDVRFLYGFHGFIPDGMLFRISSIGSKTADEYDHQRDFLNELFATMSPATRDRLMGTKEY